MSWNVVGVAEEAKEITVSRHWFFVDCVSSCAGVLSKSDSASSKI